MLNRINWIAVVVAVVLLEVLGMTWYGPLFGTAWMSALGHTPDMSSSNVMMGLGVVNTLILVVGLAWLTDRLGAVTLAASLGVCVAAWFFFDFTTQALEYLYMGLSRDLVLINMGYQLASYVVAGVVLALVKFGRRAA